MNTLESPLVVLRTAPETAEQAVHAEGADSNTSRMPASDGKESLSRIPFLSTYSAVSTIILALGLCGTAAETQRGADPFQDAVAVWHLGGLKDDSGKNALKVVGAVTTGVRLEGKELEESLASGNDGPVARLEGGYPKANTRTFTANKRYLVLPSTRGRTGRDKVTIDVDGKPYLSVADALVAASAPDHWRFIDLKLMQGQTVAVKIQGPNAAAIDLVKLSDEVPGKYPAYQEPGRPQVHFSPLRGSLNDPAGMVYYQGTWHFYYANKRFYNDCGNLNSLWGHATSADLVHWEEQPLFLSAVDGKYSFWTGGAAVDVENATGLGKPGKPAIVYSANNGAWGPSPFTQCIFVSTDGGMTAQWDPEMMYKPLPREDSRRGGGTRDPMIIWYAPEKKWVMVVYNQSAGRNGFYFFESKELKNWSEMSVLDDMSECPNLFQLPVDGNTANLRWVTWGSGTEYLIGKFNGRAFVPEDNRRQRVNYGGFGASQVFANAPEGRIVQIGWAQLCDYDGEFSRMAAFPLDLTLRTTPEGLRLHAEFVPELAKLRKQGSQQKDVVVKSTALLQVGDLSQPAEIIAEFDPGTASRVSFTGPELSVSWTAQNQEITVNGERSRLGPQNGRMTVHILLDIPSVEVVTSRGDYLIRGRDYRKLGEKSPLEIRAEGGDVKLSRLEIYPLKSIHEGDQ